MNARLTRLLFPTALSVLLSALVLPATSAGSSAKGLYLADHLLSAFAVQKNDLGKADGEDRKFSGVAQLLHIQPASRGDRFSSTPAPAPKIAHTVAQARAPPHA